MLTFAHSVESLRKLHKRLKTTDTYLDGRYDPSLSKNTTRAAWAEVRDNLDRGASVTVFVRVKNLKEDVRVRNATSPYCELVIGSDRTSDRPQGARRTSGKPLCTVLSEDTG